MARYKYPIEYDLSPDTLENGAHWLTLRLQNKGDENLQNLNIKMHLCTRSSLMLLPAIHVITLIF